MRIYVVGFAPTHDGAAVGGFDWFPEDARGRAVARAVDYLAHGDDHSLTFVPLEIPDGIVESEAVTNWIDSHLELIEVSRNDPEPKAIKKMTWVKDGSISFSGTPKDGGEHYVTNTDEYDTVLHVFAEYEDGTTEEWSVDFGRPMPQHLVAALDACYGEKEKTVA